MHVPLVAHRETSDMVESTPLGFTSPVRISCFSNSIQLAVVKALEQECHGP